MSRHHQPPHRLPHHVCLVPCLLLSLAACGPEASSTAPRSDTSLTVADYMERGMPATDRPWNGSDCAQLLRVLQELPAEQLPTTSSARSRPVIARLTSRDNLELAANTDLPLGTRIQHLMALQTNISSIAKLYLAKAQNDQRFADDLTLLMKVPLDTFTALAPLLHQFLATLDSSDPSYETRMQGLEQMKRGLSQTVQGIIIMLVDDRQGSPQIRAELAASLAAGFPQLAEWLPPLTRTEFAQRLQRAAAELPDAEVRRALAPLLPR